MRPGALVDISQLKRRVSDEELILGAECEESVTIGVQIAKPVVPHDIRPAKGATAHPCIKVTKEEDLVRAPHTANLLVKAVVEGVFLFFITLQCRGVATEQSNITVICKWQPQLH